MKIMNVIPLLSLPLVFYHILVFSNFELTAGPVVQLYSGANWHISCGDLIIFSALLVLFVELLKATRTGTYTIWDHSLSLLLLLVSLVEFIVWQEAATSSFFFIVLMMLVDVVAGFTITIVGARRDFGRGIIEVGGR
ncbi:MAG TPA: hypothetical protein EYO59_13295 [Chromatiaceae bacterium]|nr:hypothetical protein [Chromatiaceae bacterium]